MDFLAKRARERHDFFLDSLKKGPVDHLQFDDLITTEHTKLKPLSISIAVDAKRRFILGAEVSIIPAFGLLAKLSREKYGRRSNGHYQRFKGAKGAVVGQGELKKLKRDPLFMINHTCAMLRANINRLI